MGDVIPFPRVKRTPQEGLLAALLELDTALAELQAACDERDALQASGHIPDQYGLTQEQYRELNCVGEDDGA